MKYFSFAVFLLLSGIIHAQHKLKVSFQAGGNVAYQSVKSMDNFKNQPIVSCHLAALVEKRFSQRFAVETGLSFQGKGRHINMDGLQDVEGSSTTRMMYLEIPLNAVARFPLSKTAKAFLGGGPYMAAGLGGKQDYGNGNVRGTSLTVFRAQMAIIREIGD